jgi:hypothetical protein
MKRALKLFRLLIIASVISSCTGYQYVASPAYAPFFSRKGEFQGNIYPCSIQLGYALSNHIALFGTAYDRLPTGRKINPFYDGTSMRYQRRGGVTEINLGAVFFTKRNKFLYEVVAGVGGGSMDYSLYRSSRSSYYDFKMDAATRNIHIQPNFGIQFNRHLQLGMFAKVSLHQYHNIKTELTSGGNAEPERENLIFIGHKKENLMFLNSGVSFRGGWTYIQFHVQASPTINISSDELRYQKINLNLGISFKTDFKSKRRQ